MKLGITGYPLSGKTTLFSLLTGMDASKLSSGAAPFHLGVMQILDDRLDWLQTMAGVPKKVYISLEIIDFAALREGILKETEYIAQLRIIDGFLHVIGLFDTAVENMNNTAMQLIHDLDLQFMLSDLESTQNRIERIKAKIRKVKDKQLEDELPIIEKCCQWLSEEKPLRDLTLLPEEEKLLRGFGYLSLKPIMHVINIADSHLSNTDITNQLHFSFLSKKVSSIICSIKLEKELTELSPEDAEVFAGEWNLKEWGASKFAKNVLAFMSIISFFTIGKEEVRSWNLIDGTTAHKAAGSIHTDMEKGFIKAEVISFEELKKIGNFNEARKRGALKFEGKEYIVKEGDIITFKFNV
ncbi:MAG: hypothetical protein A2Y62_06810 [Candidatus Fischerbacteria bacterium RBG_13_37_8]|uniref:TGS domain-containing protein n=1 Tax=Candidatus Fischerbacteria bacterium RBG_13_37_8 TaxID=1817863 RepID=A0A1F5VM82_9BACT|nr:MAG: hypothetical protein A2Y62_06810 [Candidatus Fischerbacteria bacterium RBG_13_37_8]